MTDARLETLLKEYSAEQVYSETVDLYRIVEKLNPKIILEIGVNKGGTLKLWSTLLDKNDLLIAIDSNPDGVDRVAWDLKEAECEIRYIKGESQFSETMERMNKVLNGRKIDFAFIDGNHSESAIANDYRNYISFLSFGGIMAFHDIVKEPGVHSFWKKLDVEKYELIENRKEAYGIGYIMKKGGSE